MFFINILIDIRYLSKEIIFLQIKKYFLIFRNLLHFISFSWQILKINVIKCFKVIPLFLQRGNEFLIYKSRDSPNISSVYPFLTYFIKNYNWSCLVTEEVKIRVKFIPMLFLVLSEHFTFSWKSHFFKKYQFTDKPELLASWIDTNGRSRIKN